MAARLELVDEPKRPGQEDLTRWGSVDHMRDPWDRLQRRIKVARERVREQPDRPEYRAQETIRQLRALRDVVDELIEAEVVRWRDQGVPWVWLGTSKQQAYEVYRRAVRNGTAERVKRS